MGKYLRPLTYYEFMGLDKGSTISDIKKRYEKLKHIFSSNHALMRVLFDVEELFLYNSLLDAIYDEMIDPDKRREYDMEMEGHLESLKESFPESFNISQLLRKYHKQKKADTKFVKHDIFGRAATLTKDHIDVEQKESNQQFEKISSERIDGGKLKELREHAGISLKSISDHTKMSLFVIRAIEDNNYAQLPSDVYVRGFIKLYCKALKLKGENTEKVVEDYIFFMKGGKVIVNKDSDGE